jgi:hypothetical protein
MFHLPFPMDSAEEGIQVLFRMIETPSVFVKSGALVSLMNLGRQHESMRKGIADPIRLLLNDRSIAIRSKAIKAEKIRENDSEPIPAGWVKAKR